MYSDRTHPQRPRLALVPASGQCQKNFVGLPAPSTSSVRLDHWTHGCAAIERLHISLSAETYPTMTMLTGPALERNAGTTAATTGTAYVTNWAALLHAEVVSV